MTRTLEPNFDETLKLGYSGSCLEVKLFITIIELDLTKSLKLFQNTYLASSDSAFGRSKNQPLRKMIITAANNRASL